MNIFFFFKNYDYLHFLRLTSVFYYIQDPVLNTEDVERLNSKKPLSVLKKVTMLTMPVMLYILNHIVRDLKCHHCDAITGAETHHLLSPELCEHSDQHVSTQRGGCAAAAAADPHQGETGACIQGWEQVFVWITIVSCRKCSVLKRKWRRSHIWWRSWRRVWEKPSTATVNSAGPAAPTLHFEKTNPLSAWEIKLYFLSKSNDM